MIKRKNNITGLLIVFTYLAFISCKNETTKSALPLTPGEETIVSYGFNEDMTPGYLRIVLFKDSLRYIEKKGEGETFFRDTIIDGSVRKQFYDLFVVNKIDLIKKDSTMVVWADAGYEEISIYNAGGKNYNITYGSNTPLDRNDLKRFNAVATEFKKLAEKYRPR